MRQELDGVATAAPVAINVLRRAPAAPPPPAPGRSPPPPRHQAPPEDEVALLVDENSSAGVELQVGGDLESMGLEEQAAGADGDLEMPSDLTGDVGDAFADGAPEAPPEDEVVASSTDDEFADFMGTGASAEATSNEDPFEVVPGTGMELLSGEGVVPASADGDAYSDHNDSLMGDLPADPFAPDLVQNGQDGLSTDDEMLVAGDSMASEADGFDENPSTMALDRGELEAAMAAAREAARVRHGGMGEETDPHRLGSDADADVAAAFDAEPAPPEDEYSPPPASSYASADDDFVPEPEPEPELLPEPEPEPPPPVSRPAPKVPARPAAPPPKAAPPKAAAPVAPPAPKAPPPAAKGPPAQDTALDFFPDEMAEAEFFITNGLFDEAREILGRVAEDVDDSPRVAWLLKKVDALEAGEEPPPEPTADGGGLDGDDDNAFNLARELADELGDVAPAEGGDEPVQVSVESVLAEFKKGVDRVVAQDDADTHHDLGIAYKEMGLVEDAVGEFEKAARNAKKEADAYYMVGLCRMEQGQTDDAVQAFVRALKASIVTDHQRTAVGYELGNALQSLGKNEQAMQAFQRVADKDPGFKDVVTRIEALMTKVGPKNGNGSNGSHGSGGGSAPKGSGGDGGKKGKNIGYI